jgi:hypothetical protein
MAEVPLDEATRIEDALGGTVNDVILAVAADGIHRLMAGRSGPRGDSAALRTMMTASTREAPDRKALGNRVTTLFVDLPAGPMEPIQLGRQHRHPYPAAPSIGGLLSASNSGASLPSQSST